MILVLLGTQNNSFHRLLKEIEKCIDNGVISDKVIVQAGGTKFASTKMDIFDIIPNVELEKMIDDANLIISHGGVGSIVLCLKKDKKVIAVPRLKQYGEHVNDHQIEIVNNFNVQGFLKGVMNLDDLGSTIRTMDTFVAKKFESQTEKMLKIISDFIDN